MAPRKLGKARNSLQIMSKTTNNPGKGNVPLYIHPYDAGIRGCAIDENVNLPKRNDLNIRAASSQIDVDTTMKYATYLSRTPSTE